MVQTDSLLKEIDKFGFYHVLVTTLVTYSRMFPAMVTYSSIFVAGNQTVRCTSHPEIFENTTEYCLMDVNVSGVVETVHCTNWSYATDEFESTIISQFNLVCNKKYLVQLSTTIYFLGFLVGCIFYGLISDKFGRIPALLTSASHLGGAFIASGFAPNFTLYCFLRFLSGWATGGLLTCLYSYGIEITNPKNRLILTSICTNGWTLGMLAITLLAYFVRNHVTLHIIIGGSAFSVVLFTLPMKESPRWLYNTGKIERARACIKTIVTINCRKNKIEENRTTENENKNENNENEVSKQVPQTPQRQGNTLDLLRPWAVCKNTLIIWFNWFIVSMAYYEISLSIGRMGGSVYMNNVYSSLVEPAGRITIVILSWKLGRKILMISSYWLSAVCIYICAYTYTRSDLVAATVGVSMTGKFFVISAFELIWMYTAEATPTVIRTTGLGGGSTWARVGGMLAPQIALLGDFWHATPFIVLGSLPLICGALTYFLPETKGRRLPETIAEGVLFAQGKKIDYPKLDESENQEMNPNREEKYTKYVID